MNFIFFSPQFPKNSTEFCFHLKEFGVNVLGIGDVDYNLLNDRLKYSLKEYYKVSSMESYDEILRAVGYFTHKFGKIDRFESLNEYWLETEAKIRTDFNIYGTKIDFVYNLKQKSKMKDFFKKSGVETVRCLSCTNKITSHQFIQEIGYPIIVKPDLGAGASHTFKFSSDLEFDNFFNNKPSGIEFIIEEYVDGVIYTYDGLVDRYGNIQFAVSHLFEQSIMDVVNTDHNLYYFCLKYILPEVEEAGRKILKSFDVREKFFHIELFKNRKDGRIIALEVNMRPPGAWMTDAINFSYDTNIYREWANMVVNNRIDRGYTGKYFTAYASRKNHKNYANSHQDILNAYKNRIVNHDAIENIFSRAMGNYAYQFRAETFEEVSNFVQFVQSEEIPYYI